MIGLSEPKVVRVNGVELHYVEQGEGDAVIFVHGGNTDYRSWVSQLPAVGERYHAVSYSRRYHFPNDGAAEGAQYRATDHRDDLAALIEALGLAPAHIVASSYGAFISLLVARARPDLVRSLALGEPPLPMLFGPEAVRSSAEQVRPSREAFDRGEPERAVRLFMDTVVGPGGFDRFPPPAQQMLLDNAPEFSLEVHSSPENYYAPFTADDARAMRAPTLLLTGEESPPFLHRMTDELARYLPAAERAVIPHASHGMHNQNPLAYNEAVLAFLERHRSTV